MSSEEQLDDLYYGNSTAPIGNYYGIPEVCRKGAAFVFRIENHCGWEEVEISEELYNAWVKEFAGISYCDDCRRNVNKGNGCHFADESCAGTCDRKHCAVCEIHCKIRKKMMEEE